MSGSRSDWPAVPDFHPEFGFLCPSPRRRRGIRLAVLSMATTVAIGATMGLAVAHRTDGSGPASAAQPKDGQPSAQVPAPAVDATRLHETCKGDAAQDLAAFFLNRTCVSNKPHGRHGARTANRVVTVIIGRTDATPAPVAATAIEPSQASGGNAEKPANLTAAAVERTAPPAKASASMTVAAPAPAVNGAMVSAYASTPRFRPQSYERHGDPFRSIALQPGFEASSNRSWRQLP
jgi:hypothetical protein